MLIQDLADGSECSQEGDFICDTPPDPDAGIYPAMVNYTDSEMNGIYDGGTSNVICSLFCLRRGRVG